MSLKKTRKGSKLESVNDTIQDADISKIPDTPDLAPRTLRTRLQKQKIVAELDVEQSPKLNESRRLPRKAKEKKTADVDNLFLNTVVSARKRTRKDKNAKVSSSDETVLTEHDETQETAAIAKRNVNRSRRKGFSKKNEITDFDSTESLLNDQNIIHNDILKCTEKQKYEVTSDNQKEAVNEDEIANVSKKASRRMGRTPTTNRLLQTKSSNINSPNLVTPECSPLTVTLTPHRATKTPRKSPINIGSPKTHSLSPQRLSKTPRKLPVTVDSPSPSNQQLVVSLQNINGTVNKSKAESDEKLEKETLNRSSVRRASKSPKIVLKVPKLKSPHAVSRKMKKSPQSTNKSPKKAKSPKVGSAQKVMKSSTDAQSIDMENLSTPAISPESRKKLIVIESPKRQQSMGKKRSSITGCRTSLRSTTLKSVVDAEKELDISQNNSAINTPLVLLAGKAKSSITSSTPKERIRRSLNLSPSLNKSSLVSGGSLSVESFYGTSLRSSKQIDRNDKIVQIEDESTALITDDDSSFDISGIKLVDSSQINMISLKNSNKRTKTQDKSANDTYELEEPKTPGLKKMNETSNDTYELDEPKTPGLRKRHSIVNTNSTLTENTEEPIPSKRLCRVRFASPTLSAPNKIELKNNAQKSSPPTKKGLKRKSSSHVNNASTDNLKSLTSRVTLRKRSNSFSDLTVSTPPVLDIKNRSLSINDMSSKSAQKALQNESVRRLSKPKIFITSDKKSEIKTTSARKVPNFARIHQRKFANMESLVDVKKRIEERHNAFTINAAVTPGSSKIEENSVSQTSARKAMPPDATNSAFNRFGYRLRREEAMKVIRKQSTSRRSEEYKEKERTIIKGVRTNRRFELQMQMRNIDK